MLTSTIIILKFNLIYFNIPQKFKYHQLHILDNDDEDIISYFLESFEFIDSALNENGKVLVHWYDRE